MCWLSSHRLFAAGSLLLIGCGPPAPTAPPVAPRPAVVAPPVQAKRCVELTNCVAIKSTDPERPGWRVGGDFKWFDGEPQAAMSYYTAVRSPHFPTDYRLLGGNFSAGNFTTFVKAEKLDAAQQGAAIDVALVVTRVTPDGKVEYDPISDFVRCVEQ